MIWIGTLIALGAAGRSSLPAGVAIAAAGIVLVFLLFGSAPLQQRLTVLKIREGIDTVDFPIERLKQELSIEAQRDRDAEFAAAARSIESWVCAHCGEPTPSDCPACANCGRPQFSG